MGRNHALVMSTPQFLAFSRCSIKSLNGEMKILLVGTGKLPIWTPIMTGVIKGNLRQRLCDVGLKE